MAAPLVQRVDLDAAAAQRQLAEFERKLNVLNNPIHVPVDVDVDGVTRADTQFSELRQEIERTDTGLDDVRRSADRAGQELDTAGRRGISSFRGLAASAVGLVGALAALQGIRIAVNFASGAIQAASTLEESLSKTNVVFESLAGGIQDFAEDAPKALGLSTAAALEATSTFGNLFVALGLSREAAAELSPDIVQLAADLASFNNIGVEEAVEKLRSGLVGEAEPLRTLGVNINEALVQAKALELGLVNSAGAATEAGKVQARYALILEQTTTAQGDYARTADGIANTQRTLSAEFENAQVAIGQALLPAYQALIELAPAVIAGIEDLAPIIRGMATAAAESAPDIQTLIDILQQITTIPRDLGIAGSFFGGLADTAAGLSPVMIALDGDVDRVRTGLNKLNDAADAAATSGLRDGLIDALQAGRDPALALADALATLTGLNLDSSQLQAEAVALTQISGVDFRTAIDALTTLETIDLPAGEVELFGRAVRGVFTGGAPGQISRFGEAFLTAAQLGDVVRDTEQAILSEADALDVLEQAADEAGVSVGTLLANQQALPPELQSIAALVSGTSVAYLQNVDAINAVAEATGILPGALSAAGEALRDEQGEIVGDLDTFFADLRTAMETNAEFDANLAILRALGLDALADAFAAEGTDAAERLKEAVADPLKAGLLDAQLKGFLRGQGDDVAAQLEEGIEGHPVTPAFIQSLLTAAEQADSPEVRSALLALAESLTVVIPIEFGPVPAAPGVPGGIPEFTRGEPRGTVPRGGEVTIYQTFEETPTANTQTARAAQVAQSIIQGAR